MNHTPYKCKLRKEFMISSYIHKKKHIDHIPNTFLNFVDFWNFSSHSNDKSGKYHTNVPKDQTIRNDKYSHCFVNYFF